MLYPILSETRTVQPLNGIWKFMVDTEEKPVDVHKPLPTRRTMAVPGSFNDQGVTRDIRMHCGFVWYEREFTVARNLLDQRIMLRIDAATHEADVYVNGEFLMHHKGGFLPFEGEINSLIRPGKNRLTIRVSNLLDYTTLPVGNYSETVDADGRIRRKVSENFDFFNYAGLSRYVRLYTTPRTYIEDIAITYDVDLEAARAQVNFAVEAKGDYDRVKVRVVDEAGVEVVAGFSDGKTDISVAIENLRLWQPLNAYLYNANVELYKGDELVDAYDEPFGVRTVEVRGLQFLINGQP
ncbi:MAG: beta-glucuronidase, partial [Clostridiaceae bacterium]|nr:beta-glucuronidase [Clostridiaceae bacterium]